MKSFRTFKRRKSDRIDVIRLHQMANQFKSLVDTAYAEFFKRAESLLFEQSQSGGENADHFFVEHRILKDNKDALKDNIQAQFDAWFNWKEGERPSLEELEEDRRQTSEAEWSLMEDHSLEKSLAVERYSHRAIQGSHQHWDTFVRRLSVLTADADLQDKDCPFNALKVGNLVFDAFDNLDLTFQTKNILFRVFDEASVELLSRFYQSQNEWLIAEGIIPSLKPEEVHKMRPMRADVNVVNSITSAIGTGSGEGIVIDPAVLENLMHSVSALQSQASNIPSVDDLDAVKAWSAQQAATVTQQFQGSDKSDTIALVSMLFEYFFEDEQLVDEMKHLLARMQIPTIKVAILDKTFFENNQHPARLLLNKMARAASGWQPNDNLDEDNLLNGMQNIVQRLTTEFEDDISVFDDLLETFEAIKHEYDKQREIQLRALEQAEAEALAQHESLDRAKFFLDRLLAGSNINPTLQKFLREDWYRLMAFILAKQGDSQNWRNSARIAKELVWSLKPGVYKDQAERFEQIVPKMLSGLEDGLRAIGLTDDQRESLMEQVSEHHQHEQKMASTQKIDREIESELDRFEAQLNDADNVIHGPIPLLIEEPDYSETPGDLNYYLAQVEQFEEDSWFNYQDDRGDKQRLCLSFIVADGAKFVFTNAQGDKALERSAIGLAMALRVKQLVHLDDDALVDRTLKTVAESLPEQDEARL